MAQYLVYAHDGTDEQALDRRMAARQAHLEGIRILKAGGHFILGGALLNDEGQMIGSTLVMDFDSPHQLDAWLAIEPYILGKVWEKIVIHPFKVASV